MSLQRVDYLPWSAWINSLKARGSTPSERVDDFRRSAWIDSHGARGSPSFSVCVDRFPRIAWIASLCVLCCIDGLPRTPQGCQELWGMRLRAHASQTSTTRAGDSAQASARWILKPLAPKLLNGIKLVDKVNFLALGTNLPLDLQGANII